MSESEVEDGPSTSNRRSSNAIRPDKVRFSDIETDYDNTITYEDSTLADLRTSTILSSTTPFTPQTENFSELTIEQKRKLRCVVVEESVNVPGCICKPGDGFGLGDDGLGGGSSDGLGGDINRKGYGDKFGNRRNRYGNKFGNRYGNRYGNKFGRYWGYGDGRFKDFYDGLGYGFDGEEEEGGGVGDYISHEEFMQLFFEPCHREISEVSSSYISCVEPTLQRTVIIIKPAAMEYRDTVLRAIFEAGFQIIERRYLHLTPEQVSEIYFQYYGSPSFPHLVVSVSSGPVLVLIVAANNAVHKWNKMIGPDSCLKAEWFFPISMRKRFGLQRNMSDVLYGSENLKKSNKDNRYFSPDSILEPILNDEEQVTDYLNMYVNPTLLNGLTEVVKKKPIDPILYLSEWLLTNNPFQPRMHRNIALSPT